MDSREWDQATLSKRAHLNPATVSRWFTDDAQPSIKNIRQVAEAMGIPVVEAMLAADVLTEEELQVKIVAPDPDLLTDEEVLRQVAKRMAGKDSFDDTHEVPALPEIAVTRDPTAVDLPPTLRKASRGKRNGPQSVRR